MCGIVGLYHKKAHVSGDIYDSLIQVQHRGQDAAGISTWDTNKISSHKEIGLVTEVFKNQETFDKLQGNIGIGQWLFQNQRALTLMKCLNWLYRMV